MDLKDWLMFVIAAVGATLGIFNFVRSLASERVRLKVGAHLSFSQNGGLFSVGDNPRLQEFVRRLGRPEISVEVTNLSKFAVTISEVGLCEAGDMTKGRAPFSMPLVIGKEGWPIKLEAREAATFVSREQHSIHYDFTPQTCVYATTSCDHTETGTSTALRDWSDMFKTLQKKAS